MLELCARSYWSDGNNARYSGFTTPVVAELDRDRWLSASRAIRVPTYGSNSVASKTGKA